MKIVHFSTQVLSQKLVNKEQFLDSLPAEMNSKDELSSVDDA